MKKKSENKIITTFEEQLEKEYGPAGSKKRIDFEIKAKAFAIGEILKKERHLAHLKVS